MPWPIPQPTDIFNRAAAAYVAQFPGAQPTAPNTVLGATSRILGMTAFDLYLYQGYVMNELFPDTSEDNLDRHAGNWGLTRIAPSAAAGTISWTCTSATTLPTGIILTDPLLNSYLTTSGGAVAPGAITLSLAAASAGAQGNLANGTVLTPISPVTGMAPTATVASSPALAGGAPAESNTALRTRLLARIRARGRGGNNADYVNWAFAASSLVAYAQAVPQYQGPGTVGVFVAGAGPSTLGSGVLSTISAYLGAQYAAGGVAPVTAYVTVWNATLQTLNATVHLTPDTTANRAAATSAFSAFVTQATGIGGTIDVTSIDAAIAGGSGGAFTFDRTLPAADIVLGNGTIAVAGTLSFV
jgi:uncharacterized phage protein gp47/JayE